MIKGNSRTYSLPIFKMFIQDTFHLTTKKRFAGNVSTEVRVQFNSPPKSPKGGVQPADAEEIIDLKKRSGPIGYLSGGKDATQGKEPKIGETKHSPEDYNLIISGSPVWAESPTPAIRTYINHNDLSGKKVAIFLTTTKQNQKTLEKTKTLLSNSQIIGELILEEPLNKKEEAEKTIIEWCKTLTSS